MSTPAPGRGHSLASLPISPKLTTASASNAHAPIQRVEGPHPLQNAPHHLRVELFEKLKKKDPEANLRDLILARTKHAKEVLKEYAKSRKHGKADVMMLRSLLATQELHRSGAMYQNLFHNKKLSKEEMALLKVQQRAYDNSKMLLEEYGLNKYERKAIRGYTDANKDKKTVQGEYNPRYMGKHKHWGKYKDGWTALTSALKKLPSTGKLGVTMTTYRAVREKDETQKLGLLPEGSNIAHGYRVMGSGQKHVMSTAMTYNSAHWNRVHDTGGMVAVTGRSGVFVNPFGVMGAVDGGEILYPSEVHTRYMGKTKHGFDERFRGKGHKSSPVFHLRERKHSPHHETYDDLDYNSLTYREGLARYIDQTSYKTNFLQRALLHTGIKRQPHLLGYKTSELAKLLKSVRHQRDRQMRAARLRMDEKTYLLQGGLQRNYGTFN